MFVLALVVLACMVGCETKVVGYKSFLTGLPGSEQKLPADLSRGDYKDPTLVKENLLVKEDPATKKKTLIARQGRHLMIHLYNCVDENNFDLFYDQVLSVMTKNDFAASGKNPREAFAFLCSHQADLQQLFGLMPAGEYTPGLFLNPQGNGVQRVALDGMLARGLFWNGFEMVQERGNWKLRWMVGPEKYEE